MRKLLLTLFFISAVIVSIAQSLFSHNDTSEFRVKLENIDTLNIEKMGNRIHFYCKTHCFTYDTLGCCPYCQKDKLDKLNKKQEKQKESKENYNKELDLLLEKYNNK